MYEVLACFISFRSLPIETLSGLQSIVTVTTRGHVTTLVGIISGELEVAARLNLVVS